MKELLIYLVDQNYLVKKSLTYLIIIQKKLIQKQNENMFLNIYGIFMNKLVYKTFPNFLVKQRSCTFKLKIQ